MNTSELLFLTWTVPCFISLLAWRITRRTPARLIRWRAVFFTILCAGGVGWLALVMFVAIVFGGVVDKPPFDGPANIVMGVLSVTWTALGLLIAPWMLLLLGLTDRRPALASLMLMGAGTAVVGTLATSLYLGGADPLALVLAAPFGVACALAFHALERRALRTPSA